MKREGLIKVRTVKKRDVEDGRSYQVECRIEIGRTHYHEHALFSSDVWMTLQG